MINKRLPGLVAVACVFLLASCGKKAPAYTKFIPKDANFVVGIDVRSLLEKLNKDSLGIDKLITATKDETSTENYTKALDTYNQLKDAGIDWSSRVYVATTNTGGGMMGGGSVSAEVVAGMGDVQKFEDFLKKRPDTKDIKKGDGFSYTSGSDGTIGWNKEAVIIIFNQQVPSYNYVPDDSTGNMSTLPAPDNAAADAALLTKYFSQSKSVSILDAEGFTESQSEKGDFVIFSQTGDISKKLPMLAMMPKLKTWLNGYSTSVINFENGKVVVESTGHLSKELADFLKKYAGPEVDLDLVENYPSSNIDGLMAFSFNPELFLGVAKELGADGQAESILQPLGLTAADVTKFFKGDFAVVVSDFSVGNNGVAGKDAMGMAAAFAQPSVKVMFTAKLGDKATVDKVLKVAQAKGIIVRNGNSIAPGAGAFGGASFPFAVSIVNDMLVVASDSTLFNAYLAKNQKIGLPADVKSALKGKAVAGYLDLQKIMEGVAPAMSDSSDAMAKAMYNKAKTTFKSGWYNIENLSGQSISSKAELNFVDEKTNSLSQIVRFGLFAYEQQKAQQAIMKKQWENMSTDTSANAVLMDSLKKAEEKKLSDVNK